MKDSIPSASRPSEKGFSLIEVAVALAILGLILVPFIQIMNAEFQRTKYEKTKGNLGIAKSALEKYVLREGRYPRPAAPNLAISDPNYGKEVVGGPYAACTRNIPTVCQTPGTRDSDGVGGPDPVLIGTLPFETIGIAEKNAVDFWGNKLLYAVSENQTNTYVDERGVIRLEDLAATIGPSGDDRLDFIVLSHGENARGAFNAEGVLISPCGDPAVARDNINCQNTSTFDDGTYTYAFTNPITGDPETNRSVTLAAEGSPAAWDDYYERSASPKSGLWSPLATGNNMESRNLGSIRIKTTADRPQIAVDVNGVARAIDLYSDRLCQDNSSTCIQSYQIGRDVAPPIPAELADGEGIRCWSDGAMTAISGGNERCGNLKITDAANRGSLAIPTCPAGQYPRNIDINGNITCAP